MVRFYMACMCAGGLAFVAPSWAASNKEVEALREELQQTKQGYEARLQALEANAGQATGGPRAKRFNPDISLILSGTYANLSKSPEDYAMTGFIPGDGELAPPDRGFSLAESELIISANIDPYWYGQLTLALESENEVAVEEAWIQTLQLPVGLTAKAGRLFSGIGYINEQHAHAWDFVDATLAQKAFLNGQYALDGIQLKWLAPTDSFIEFGAEIGNGKQFPGADRDKNNIGGWALFTHVGGDIGNSHNWRAGLSYLDHDVNEREFTDNSLTNRFTGDSRLWLADFIWKWAPEGNRARRYFKLQGEYYRRREQGELAHDTSGVNQNGNYRSTQSGWYLQIGYQFQPRWRLGLRYDRLQRGRIDAGAINLTAIPILAEHTPTRSSIMLDYSPSEFSRVRVQFNDDESRANVRDNQFIVQYIVSLGSHGAHKY